MERVESLDVDAVWPSVSVVMPVRNEATHISEAVDAIFAQKYEGDLDIWIAVAPSDDATERLVAELARGHNNLYWVRRYLY